MNRFFSLRPLLQDLMNALQLACVNEGVGMGQFPYEMTISLRESASSYIRYMVIYVGVWQPVGQPNDA